MKQRFRLYRRKKGGRYYLHNELTGKQESLHTNDRAKATRLLHAKNEAGELPAINLQIARAYLAATDPQIATRNRLVDANDVAKSIQKNLQAAAAEWNQSQDALERERQRFEKVCQKLDEAINLRGIHWYIVGTLA